MSKSWKPEVIADSSGKWCPNGLAFATEAEAETWARDLAMRWVLVREYRAAESDDPVTHRLDHQGRAVQIETPEGNPP